MPMIYYALLIIVFNVTAFRGAKILVTLFALKLGAPQLYIGVLAAMFSLFPMVLGIYAGKLADRYGMRRPMILGTIGLITGLALGYFYPSMAMLYVAATFMGASWVFYNICAQNLIGLLSDAESRARNFGNFGLAMSVGSFFGPIITGFSIDHLGERATCLILAAFPLFTIAIVALLRALPRGEIKNEEEGAGYSANLMKNVSLRNTVVTSGIILTGTDLYQFYMPIYGSKIGLSASAIGLILGTVAVAAFAVRLFMPRLVKRYSPDTVLVGVLYISAVCFLLFPLFKTAPTLAVLSFVFGLGIGCAQPVSLMLIYDRAPAGRVAEALGLRLMINNLTHVAVPIVFGSLATVLGMAPVFIANAAILAAGGVLTGRARKHALAPVADKGPDL